jgi:hypothetical protein
VKEATMGKPDMNYDQAMARIRELETQLGVMRRAAEMLWVVLANVGMHKDTTCGWRAQHPEWLEAAVKWRDNYFEAERRCGPPPPSSAGDAQ